MSQKETFWFRGALKAASPPLLPVAPQGLGESKFWRTPQGLEALQEEQMSRLGKVSHEPGEKRGKAGT